MKKLSVFFLLSFVQMFFSQELALVKENSKIGFINKSGDYVIQPKFEAAKSFSDGLAAVKVGQFWDLSKKMEIW